MPLLLTARVEGTEQTNNALKNIFNSLPAYCTLNYANLDELSCCMHSEVEDVANENVLAWWNDHKCEFPRMYCIALNYLTAPSYTVIISLILV